MITMLPTPPADDAALFRELHPALAAWFRKRFGQFSPAQRVTLPEILAGRSTLLSSPTGSGKTLAAFLGVFDYLAKAHDRGELPKGIVAVYVSPLRALAYDIQKNLTAPLAELGWDFIRVGLRTGDTSAKDRAAQKRKPPHILVTTPESLTLVLSQLSWVPAFKPARFLIVDELHALAENKRGALLMVAAERLEEVVTGPVPAAAWERSDNVAARAGSTLSLRSNAATSGTRPLTRIGLSATVSPLATMAEFLVGPGRSCGIAEVTQRKAAHIEVFSPLRQNPYPPAGYTGTRVLRELGEVLRTKRTTLIFTNTRSGAETIGIRLKEILPDLAPQIEVHHASLDRAVRLDVEDRLKRGELRAVVCSTSLEMGIDIGSIDLVVMVSAPKGVSRALQRIGRSGHSMGEISRGLLVASNINDLVECAVTARMMERRALEPVKIHDDPLDVLAQHLVGLAIFESATLDEAYALVRRSYSFRHLSRDKFDRVVRYLEGGGASLERNYREVFGKVVVIDGVLRIPRPKVAREFYQNVGTISTDQMIQVKLKRRNLGQVEESFMKRLRIGDVFVLNGRCVRLVKTELLVAKVVEAKSTLPTVPRWNANKMPLASGLAAEVVRLRTEVAARLKGEEGSVVGGVLHPDSKPEAATSRDIKSLPPPPSPPPETAENWLTANYDLSRGNVEAVLRHFRLQAQVSAIPTGDFFLIERFIEGDLCHCFFHSLIGRSANDALSRIIAQRLQDARGGNALVTIDDYGFMFTLRHFQDQELVDWQRLFGVEGADEALKKALEEASLVKWQFRVAAQTGLMVPRRVHGKERGSKSLQWSAEIIFNVLRRYEPDHPLLAEAYAEATLRFLDLPRAEEFLRRVATLPWKFVTTERVSPFSFGMYVTKIKETMTLEDPEITIERLYHAMYGPAAERMPAPVSGNEGGISSPDSNAAPTNSRDMKSLPQKASAGKLGPADSARKAAPRERAGRSKTASRPVRTKRA